MAPSRDHHFVPAFYLKQWCHGVDEKLVEHTIKQGKVIPKPVGRYSTGYEFDLYAFPELPDNLSQFIEDKFFHYADQIAADALALHLTGNLNGWTQELRSAWSRFLLALHLRHPDAMPELRVAVKAMWEAGGGASQQQYDLMRQPFDPETFDEYLAARDPYTAAKAQVNLMIKAVFDNPSVGKHINGMHWATLDVSAAPHLLLTSDRPMGLSVINHQKGSITLPIAPTKLFIAVNDRDLLHQIKRKRPREIVSHVNTILVARARRFVWAGDRAQLAFIQKHMSTRMEPMPLLPTTMQTIEAMSSSSITGC